MRSLGKLGAGTVTQTNGTGPRKRPSGLSDLGGGTVTQTGGSGPRKVPSGLSDLLAQFQDSEVLQRGYKYFPDNP